MIPWVDRRDRVGRVGVDELGVGIGVPGLTRGTQTGIDQPAADPSRLQVDGLQARHKPDQQFGVQVAGVAPPPGSERTGNVTQARHGDAHRGDNPGRAVPASADDQLTPHGIAHLDAGLPRQQQGS